MRQALTGYLERLSPEGMLVYHLSNRNLDLLPVVAANAAAENLIVLAKGDNHANNLLVDYRANALVAVFARNAADLGDLPNRPGWIPIRTDRVPAWTDDYSNVLSALLRSKILDRINALAFRTTLPLWRGLATLIALSANAFGGGPVSRRPVNGFSL